MILVTQLLVVNVRMAGNDTHNLKRPPPPTNNAAANKQYSGTAQGRRGR
jgi:hypothetical protein